jgi:hypothetical protein
MGSLFRVVAGRRLRGTLETTRLNASPPKKEMDFLDHGAYYRRGRLGMSIMTREAVAGALG